MVAGIERNPQLLFRHFLKKHFSTIFAKNILRESVNVINTLYTLFLKELVVAAQTCSS